MDISPSSSKKITFYNYILNNLRILHYLINGVMMTLIYRTINNIDIAIDINTSRDVYFTEQFLKSNDVLNSSLDQNNVLNMLSKSSQFTPLYLMWEMIDKCNFSCPFCYIVGHSNNKLIRFKNVKHHLEELIENGLLYCILTGGEVTYHKDFLEI